ncbi:MAG: HesA/MoeB/ThiF family protein [Sulfolobales archaeon]
MVGKDLLEYIEMFSRQIIMRDFGIENQKRIMDSSVLVVGSGALGSAISIFMARSGVRRIRVLDPDEVELSNLPRTLAYKYSDARERTPKAYALARSLREIFPDVEIEYVIDSFDVDNAQDLLKDVDLVMDGLDNMRSRFIVNEAAILSNKPYIYSAVEGFYGVVMPVIPGETACLRCIYDPQSILSKAESDPCNIIGVSVLTVVATATVASRIALDIILGKKVDSKIHYIDLRKLELGSLVIHRNPKCPVCSLRETEFIGRVEPLQIIKKCSKENIYQIKLSRKLLREDLEKISSIINASFSEDIHRYILSRENITIELYKNSRIGLVKGLKEEELSKLLNLIKDSLDKPRSHNTN